MTTDKIPATLATVKHGGCVQLSSSERERFDAFLRGNPSMAFMAGRAWQVWQAALSARQPVGEPVAWQIRRSDGSPLACWEACTQDAFDATKRTGRYLGYENGPLCEVRALYVSPLAQAVDLGQFRQPVQDWLDDAQASMEEHGDYDGVFGHAIEEGTRLLALIDSHSEMRRG